MDKGLLVVNEDVVKWAGEYDGERFHALLTDCPYEYGFMGKSWDESGVSFNPDTWSKLGEHLYPGAFGMTYTGARTWHRIAVAIEDAGFIIHPSIFCWTYATGLHKAARIDTWIDKEEGAYDEREVVEKSTATYGYQRSGERWAKDHYVTRAATDEAKTWENYRYGLQALRPAVEPIILFQKPYDQKSLDAIREYGAGALDTESAKYNGGKWPTNFVVVHHPLCTESQCYMDCNVLKMREKSGYFIDFPSVSMPPGHEGGQLVMYHKKSLGLERDAVISPVSHPTVKSIAVNKWLASMLLPPDEYKPRRILVPFAGVMSEAIGAMLAGWEHVTGIEVMENYAEFGEKRATWWLEMANMYGNDVKSIINGVKSGAQQLTLGI